MNHHVFKASDAHKLEDPQRLRWLPPAEVIALLQLVPGTKVADIGAGTGYFSVPIARAIGTKGHVFAVDLQQEMLDMLHRKLEQPDAPRNISLHLGSASEIPLERATVDVAFYANIWHELDDTEATIAQATRVLTAGAKIAILDWRDDCLPPPGPPQDHRISAQSVVTFLLSKRFRAVECHSVGEFAYLVTGELPNSIE